MSVNLLIRIVACERELRQAAAKLQKAPGTSARGDTFMSRASSSVSSTVASRMRCRLKVESVGDSQYCSAHKT